MTATAPSTPTRPRELLHVGMWTLLGLMGFGLVLVPLLRPSILWTSLFFGWSNVMVAYMAYRMVTDLRRRDHAQRATQDARQVAPPVVRYTFGGGEEERPRARSVRAEPPIVEA